MKRNFCVEAILLLALLLSACAGNRQEQYEQAVALYEDGAYGEAAVLLESVGVYEQAPELLERIENFYKDACSAYERGAYSEALWTFRMLAGYKDADIYAEEIEKMPVYSDSEVTEAAFQAFKNKRKGTYQGAQSLYHSSDYENAYVQYDSSTKTYTCTMTCTYSTNIFDIWGTSTSTYYVTVQLLDTGSGLSVIGYTE